MTWLLGSPATTCARRRGCSISSSGNQGQREGRVREPLAHLAGYSTSIEKDHARRTWKHRHGTGPGRDAVRWREPRHDHRAASPTASPTTKLSSDSDAAMKGRGLQFPEVERVGRMIDAILTNTVLLRISEEHVSRTVERPLGATALGVKNGDFSFDFA